MLTEKTTIILTQHTIFSKEIPPSILKDTIPVDARTFCGINGDVEFCSKFSGIIPDTFLSDIEQKTLFFIYTALKIQKLSYLHCIVFNADEKGNNVVFTVHGVPVK